VERETQTQGRQKCGDKVKGKSDMRPLVFLTITVIAVIVATFPMIYAQDPDPKTTVIKQAVPALPQDVNAPPADPNIPKLARQTLSGQILPTGEDWTKYFDTTPRDTVQVHYNLWVFLNVLRLQEAQIKQLTERVAALEKKLVIDPNKPMGTK